MPNNQGQQIMYPTNATDSDDGTGSSSDEDPPPKKKRKQVAVSTVTQPATTTATNFVWLKRMDNERSAGARRLAGRPYGMLLLIAQTKRKGWGCLGRLQCMVALAWHPFKMFVKIRLLLDPYLQLSSTVTRTSIRHLPVSPAHKRLRRLCCIWERTVV